MRKTTWRDYEEMVSPEARGDRYHEVMNDGKPCSFLLRQKGERELELGLGMKPEHCRKKVKGAAFAAILNYHGKFCTTNPKAIRG